MHYGKRIGNVLENFFFFFFLLKPDGCRGSVVHGRKDNYLQGQWKRDRRPLTVNAILCGLLCISRDTVSGIPRRLRKERPNINMNLRRSRGRNLHGECLNEYNEPSSLSSLQLGMLSPLLSGARRFW